MSTPTGPQDPNQPPSYGSTPPPPPAYGDGAAYGGGAGYGGGSGAPAGSPPPNYLVWAIISVFLCWPLAIPAIIFSTQVNSKWALGDAAGAHEASAKAKKFSLWATIAGAVYIVLLIILFSAGFFASMQATSY